MATPSPTENLPSKPKAKPGLLTLFLFPILLTITIFNFSINQGYAMGGIFVIFPMVMGAFICLIILAFIDWVLRKYHQNRRKTVLWCSIVAIPLLINGGFVFICYGENGCRMMNFLTYPAECPADVTFLRGSWGPPDVTFHFNGSPASVAAMIRSKNMVEHPIATNFNEVSDPLKNLRHAVYAYCEGWWQPTNLADLRYFSTTHTNQFLHVFYEGWWINGATNEAFVRCSPVMSNPDHF